MDNEIPKAQGIYMILVTGANGFVGHNLVALLVSKGIEIRCLVRSSSPELELFGDKVEIVQGDICDMDSVNNAMKGVSQVVHLAALIKSHDADSLHSVNVEGTNNLILSSRQHNIRQFIFLSTLNVALPLKNLYSSSKLEAEEAVRGGGINYTILRPSIIYGMNNKGTIGKFIKTVKRRKLVLILGNGEYKVQPLYINDMTGSICEVLDDAERFREKTLFLAGRDIVSYNQLVDMISDAAGVRNRKLHIPLSLVTYAAGLLSILSKRGVELKEQLMTYSVDKTIDSRPEEDVFPLEAYSLREGLLRSGC